ncbi:YbaB/EbfC family nucleoid-associated protein [Anaerofustis sp.]|uniref:YbaB/EbfC family nucleoid-associated protein n=1 Tax=Anaerofustis sp. TaxID=1872517 RepID=UPI0025B80168|nr:YbaB/EbfC family nucleoid-associated protein [Anaerofustis sp.]
MAKGRMNGFGGGAGMSGMMKQVQKMQADMEKMQKELEESTYEATSGGGAVKAVVSGEKLVKSIEVDPDMLKEEDAEIVCDMIVAAVNEAINKASNDANSKMGSITGGLGGLNIPGL